MKWLKRWIAAFIAGEIAMLWKKDSSFKQGIEEKKGLDKVWFIFERLFHFNQELFTDTKQTLKNLDIDSELTKAKSLIESEALKLKLFLQQKEWEVQSVSKTKATQVLNEAEKRYNALYTYVHGFANDMIAKYHLEEKLNEVKETYEILKKKTKDIKEA